MIDKCYFNNPITNAYLDQIIHAVFLLPTFVACVCVTVCVCPILPCLWGMRDSK